MYNKIVNPETNKNVSIYSKLGKEIVKNYFSMIKGGSGPRPHPRPPPRTGPPINWVPGGVIIDNVPPKNNNPSGFIYRSSPKRKNKKQQA